MLSFLIFVLLIAAIRSTKDIYHLRRINTKGPIAWSSGVGCLDQVAKIYFQPLQNYSRPGRIVVTHLSNMSSPAAEIQDYFLKIQNDKINSIINSSKEEAHQILVISDKFKFSSVVRPDAIVTIDFYVIVVDDADQLKNFLETYLTNTANWNPGAKFLILYNNDMNYDFVDDITNKVFEIMLNDFYVTNVILLFAKNPTTYAVRQLLYYSKNNCRGVEVTNFKDCRNGNLSVSDLKEFTDELSKKNVDMKNCTFKACCKIAAPFVEETCKEGFELHLLHIIENNLKFHLEKNCSQNKRGILKTDNNWTDLLQKLENGECDLIIGGFYPDNDVHKYFWVTDPYLRDTYKWYVSKASLQPAWKGLISIFTNGTWLLLLVTLLITWITWLIIGKYNQEDQNQRSISLIALKNLGVTLGFSITNHPKLPPLRIFFIGLILFGLNMTSIYTSNLVTVFTNPKYDDQITTFQEVLNEGISFGGPQENHDWFTGNKDIFPRYNKTKSFELNESNLQLVAAHKQVILANEMYILQSNYSDQLFGLASSIYSSPVEMIMKRGFPVLIKFNEIIGWLSDAGLFSKLSVDFYYNKTLLKYIKERRKVNVTMITLTINHLGGAFAVLLVGLGFSTIAFIIELLTPGYIGPILKRQRNRYRLLRGDFKRTPPTLKINQQSINKISYSIYTTKGQKLSKKSNID